MACAIAQCMTCLTFDIFITKMVTRTYDFARQAAVNSLRSVYDPNESLAPKWFDSLPFDRTDTATAARRRSTQR